MEDYPPVLQNLIYAFIPEDAAQLPLQQQKAVIQQMTGYTPTSVSVITRFLDQPSYEVLFQDIGVLTKAKKDILHTTGIKVTTIGTVIDYFGGDKQLYVLARVPDLFDQLEQEYPEDFEELLIEAGTLDAIKHWEENVVRHKLQLADQDLKYRFYVAISRSEDEKALNYIELEAGLRPTALWLVDNLSSEGVAFVARASNRNYYLMSIDEGDEIHARIVSILLLYYQREDVVSFIQTIYGVADLRGVDIPNLEAQLDNGTISNEIIRTELMGGLLELLGDELDIDNPTIQAYVNTYPNYRQVIELLDAFEPLDDMMMD